ncbi:type VI secretion system tube protein Hcp [Pseudomonas gingeri]|uniref:Type VI secretion system tube protein Hcp n=1 Tax=Pseudomonas gingeri TaxID=117681 RepID=A0A7Y7X8T9_9PSED|nr:type VI secretion system tube protein Hcp [Pseudomonas gingeri]NWA25924.1 type VI secretion system tube protein Hcp [Pseudomonas gingeri]NWB95423.1 type VI secretion system tube protein Hcp [Pseudomonas gingeri]NWD67440.1 type VI secretion system tube protein Hcp [Pseudomonas gingeri]NWD74255.1 type VI secretion system tube protein Hcp [Pseudomonas gingeri]
MIVLKFKTEIKGNCQEKDHQGWIVIDSWGFSSGRSIAIGNDREPSVGHVTEITLNKTTDIASPNLFIESVSGKSLEEATLRVIQTSGSSTSKNEPYVEFTLTAPIISSYSISGGSDRPTETFQISFTSMKYKYKHFVDGKSVAELEKSYNLLSNTTV